MPVLSVEMPLGAQKFVLVPIPSAYKHNPTFLLPASVVTAPAVVTARICLNSASATNIRSRLSTATPRKSPNHAEVPMPFPGSPAQAQLPTLPPASVVTSWGTQLKLGVGDGSDDELQPADADADREADREADRDREAGAAGPAVIVRDADADRDRERETVSDGDCAPQSAGSSASSSRRMCARPMAPSSSGACGGRDAPAVALTCRGRAKERERCSRSLTKTQKGEKTTALLVQITQHSSGLV
jgi:hypothetical protein